MPPVFPPSREVRLEVKPEKTPALVLALLVAVLPDAPVRLDSALIGAEAPDDPSDAAVPAAACGTPVPDAAPGVASVCRAWGTDEINCAVVVCALLLAWVPVACATAPAWPASPPGLVVCGGGVNVENADAEAELAA
jgi:hypothetical protein